MADTMGTVAHSSRVVLMSRGASADRPSVGEGVATWMSGNGKKYDVDVRHRRRGAGLLVLELARELLQQFLRLAANAGGQHTFCVTMTGELTANTTTCFCPPAMPSSRRLGHFLPCAELSPFSSGHLPAA